MSNNNTIVTVEICVKSSSSLPLAQIEETARKCLLCFPRIVKDGEIILLKDEELLVQHTHCVKIVDTGL